MIDAVTKILMKVFPKSWYRNLSVPKQILFNGYAKKGYSFHGEDLIVHGLLKEKRKGFYVDVGAWHPFMNSNTYFFYKKGWKGINIDVLPGSMKMFSILRSKDTNLEIGISKTDGKMTYYRFEDSDLNTFDKHTADLRVKRGLRLIDKIDVKMMPLKKLLDKNLPKKTRIDFMSIDVEGYELNVLQSNDWSRYVPKVIIIEELSLEKNDLNMVYDSEVYKFLIKKGYRLSCVTPLNLIFYHD